MLVMVPTACSYTGFLSGVSYMWSVVFLKKSLNKQLFFSMCNKLHWPLLNILPVNLFGFPLISSYWTILYLVNPFYPWFYFLPVSGVKKLKILLLYYVD